MYEFMTIFMKPKETVQQYGDRFTNLMRRTGRSDDDETLIPVFIKGLEADLQDLISVSRVTELTAMVENSEKPKSSIRKEIQRAITLNAGRTARKGAEKTPVSLSGTAKETTGSVADTKRKCKKCKSSNSIQLHNISVDIMQRKTNLEMEKDAPAAWK